MNGPSELTVLGSLPHAEVVVFSGASHFTFVEQPEEYFPVVRRFLREHRL